MRRQSIDKIEDGFMESVSEMNSTKLGLQLLIGEVARREREVVALCFRNVNNAWSVLLIEFSMFCTKWTPQPVCHLSTFSNQSSIHGRLSFSEVTLSFVFHFGCFRLQFHGTNVWSVWMKSLSIQNPWIEWNYPFNVWNRWSVWNEIEKLLGYFCHHFSETLQQLIAASIPFHPRPLPPSLKW